MTAQRTQTGVVIALGSAQTLAWGSTYYLPAILAVPMARDTGVSTGTVFGAFSAALVIAACLGPLVGRRIDLFGGRDVLAVSSVVFAAGLAMLGMAQGAGMLFASWLLIGTGMAMGLYEAAFSTLAGIYGRRARGAITGITLLAGFASTICWPISAYLEAEVGWRMVCFFWAAAHLVIGLPVNRFLVPRGTQPIPVAESAPSGEAPADPRTFLMILLALVFAVTWFTSTAMAAHLPRLLQEAGATPAAAIAAAALVGPAQVAGRLLEFGVLQRFHPLLSARLAAMAHPIGALALMVFGAPAAIIFTVLHGAGNGILTIAKGTLPLSIFGPANYGFRQGVLMVPARFAQAGAPFLFALLMERYGAGALLLSIALGLSGLAALLAIHPSSTKEHA
ncbi:MFS transporter [Roseinatronobacter alkalisoli]|uniref:MFS transporter n=1 Tax=Roseinatronobacter alkalisoli TaxID=3028235 RepID=A0ABT5T6T5_9RHOB|nr:MFS transporter [Roseinatronobacter sp. HJB301]MDD7970844.1 MFS transporter [Roseinatronobacter sp. HJB301]